MPAQPEKVSVLMVCLGICRSPMAEAVLKHQISQRSSLRDKFDIEVDSAGTGAYHAGDDADERTIETCRKHKIPVSSIARKVTPDDFRRFDYILAMDHDNLQTLQSRAPPSCQATISLFGEYDPSLSSSADTALTGTKMGQLRGKRRNRALEIEDPYYGGKDGFEECYKRCVVFAEGFLDRLEAGRR